MVNQNRRPSTHGGLITYIHNDFAYRELNNELPSTLTSTLWWKTLLYFIVTQKGQFLNSFSTVSPLLLTDFSSSLLYCLACSLQLLYRSMAKKL